jgi:Ala-tRNA(Pro) deacylase
MLKNQDINEAEEKTMELVVGRPESLEGRLDREIRVYDMLDKLGIEYSRVDHEAAMTMEACEAIDVALGTLMCKNLFLCNRQKTAFYLLLMPGDKKFKTKELSNQINSARLSFAEAEDMLKYLDIEPGAVSVMGLMNDKDHAVRLLVDEDVKAGEYIGCHPCVNTSSLKIKTSDIFDKFLPATGHVAEIVHLVGED